MKDPEPVDEEAVPDVEVRGGNRPSDYITDEFEDDWDMKPEAYE